MNEFLYIMIKPFLACLILTGIHAYLGFHVLRRGILFVDLALAQIAAFGATLGSLFGFALHSTGSYLLSLTATLCGAALFSLLRSRREVIPQEAWIGVVYAVTAAGSILVLSRAPQGGEELQSLMVGHLLFVGWREIGVISILYSLIGILHYRIRHPMYRLSTDPEAAYASGLPVRTLDLIFYASFGVVVTSSTELAGVLLVFSFLVVPSICGELLGGSPRSKLAVGWVIGALTSAAGIALSYYCDLPTGAAIVCVFGFVLMLCAGLKRARYGSAA